MATRFVTKKVLKNQGVNKGSNFPGPTPQNKAHRTRPGTNLARKNLVGKNLAEKNLFGKYVRKIFSKNGFFFKNDISEPRDRQNKHRLEKLMPPEQF